MRLSALLACLLIAGGSFAGCAVAAKPGVLIEYHRSGGFAGLDERLAVTPDGKATLTRGGRTLTFDLTPEALRDLQRIFEEAAFPTLRSRYLPDRKGNDLFEYVITCRGHTVRTMDTAVPESLQPVIQALNQLVARQGSP